MATVLVQHTLNFINFCAFQWRSRLLLGLRSVSAVACLNTADSMDVSCQCFVFFSQLSETNRLLVQRSLTECGVCECDFETSAMEKSRVTRTVEPWKIKPLNKYFYLYPRIIKTGTTTTRLLVRPVILYGTKCRTLSRTNETIFISVINQLDAQKFCFKMSLFHASTCFEHMCSSSGGQNCITQPLISYHTYRGPSRAQVERGFSQPVHETATYRCDNTRGCVMQFWPPDDEHMCSKHLEAWNKLIVKQKICSSSWLITEINNVKS